MYLLVWVSVIGCRSAASLPPGACPAPAAESALSGIEIAKREARPNLVRIVRDGDPRPAVAVAVQTGGGSYASMALASLLEARLQKAGFFGVDAHADRDAFRLRTLLETPERGAEFVSAVRKALAGSVAPGAAELGLVGRRLWALKRRPLEAPISAAVARCTGEIGVVAGEAALDPSSNEGVQQLEALRTAAYGASQVAFAVVGAAVVAEGVAAALYGGEAWPKGSPPAEGALSGDDQIGGFLTPERAPGTARISIVLPTRSADAAAGAARRAGDADGPLVGRLRALAVPFRVAETRATVRPRGGCLAVTLETARAYPSAGLEDASAIAVTIARQELEAARASAGEGETEGLAGSWPLGPAAVRAVRLASDPREAAELGALWSLTTPAPADEKQPFALALALPGAGADARESSPESAAQPAPLRRFSAALDRLAAAWSSPLLERRGRVERGQGELWLLLASPCGVSAEGAADPGATALALMAALATPSRGGRGVVLEPWIAPDGVGVLAHAARSPGESTHAATVRVAEEAARILAATPFSATSMSTARAALLNRIGDGVAPEGRALSALAGTLAPGHPSWLAPLGSWEELANAGADAASARWSALAGGPLRLAVLANEGEEQLEVSARTIDRWLVRSLEGGRACAPVEAVPSSKAGTIQVTVPPAPLAQALLGFAVPPQGNAESGFGELLLGGLTGADGWLSRALSSASLAATAQARIIGGPRAAALVIDIRAAESTLDHAVAQVRALLQRLRQGAIAQNDFDRSAALRDRWELEASLDPRRRIINLWRDSRPPSPSVPLALEPWKTWAAGALNDEKLVVVIARPKR